MNPAVALLFAVACQSQPTLQGVEGSVAKVVSFNGMMSLGLERTAPKGRPPTNAERLAAASYFEASSNEALAFIFRDPKYKAYLDLKSQRRKDGFSHEETLEYESNGMDLSRNFQITYFGFGFTPRLMVYVSLAAPQQSVIYGNNWQNEKSTFDWAIKTPYVVVPGLEDQKAIMVYLKKFDPFYRINGKGNRGGNDNRYFLVIRRMDGQIVYRSNQTKPGYFLIENKLFRYTRKNGSVGMSNNNDFNQLFDLLVWDLPL